MASKKEAKLIFALSPPEIRGNKSSNFGIKDLKNLKFFQSIFRSLNYQYIDFYETINKRESKNKGLYIDGIHYSPLGNQIFSNSIYDFIKNNKIIPLAIN